MIEGRQFAVRQSQGARDYQEDSAEFNPIKREDGDGLLMVLADGMGGHRGGAHASRVAVDTFIETFAREDGQVPERLDLALHDANEQVGADGKADPELEGMGCTLVGVVITKSGLEWISVGDSPMWLVRGGHLQRLNEDHSMAPILAKQVETGELTAEEAARHPQRNALRSAVIGETMQHIDKSKQPVRFRKGDRLLIASDGVETLSEDEIAALFNDSKDADAENLAETLVSSVDAVQRKGQDNTTVMVVDLFFGGAAAFGAVDPEAPTEKVTRRTITPIRKPKKKDGSMGKGALVLVLLLLVVGAAVGWIYRAEIKALVGGGENITTGTSAGTSGAGTAKGEPKTEKKPAISTGSTANPKKATKSRKKTKKRKEKSVVPQPAEPAPGSRSDVPKAGGTNPEDRPLKPGTKDPTGGTKQSTGGETTTNPDAKKPAPGAQGPGAQGDTKTQPGSTTGE